MVDAGSYTKAAGQLSVSQPALSAAISKLEQELHVKLLVRGSRSLQLTPAGKLAYTAAKALLASTANLRARLASLASERTTLAVGMIDSVADVVFASKINLSDIDDTLQLSTVVDNSRLLLRALEKEELDVAFVTEQPRTLHSPFKLRHVATEPLVLVAHPQATIQDADLLPKFIAYDQASATYQLVADTLKRRGLQTQPIGYSASPHSMLRLLQQQKGTAALPYGLVREALRAGDLKLVTTRRPLLIGRRIDMARLHSSEPRLLFGKLRRQIAHSLDDLMDEAHELVYGLPRL